MMMKTWNGTRWVPVVRVYAGYIANNIAYSYPLNVSQVNLSTSANAGYLLYYNNSGMPVTSIDNNKLSFFITTEDNINSQQDMYNSYTLDTALIEVKAMQNILKYSCVALSGPVS